MNHDESGPRAMGIRASPRRVHYAIVEGADNYEILTVASVVVPPALALPEQLHFVRTTLLDLMAEYGVRRAGIRLTEPNARSTAVVRLSLEGVIQELLSSSNVEFYFAGAIATISAHLGEKDRSTVKRYFEGQVFMGLDAWGDYSREQRESIVTAVAAARPRSDHV